MPLTIGLFGKNTSKQHAMFLRANNKQEFNEWLHLLSVQSKEGAAIGSWKTTDKAVEDFSKTDIVIVTTDRGIIIGANSASEQLGWKKEELIGHSLSKLLVPSMQAAHQAYMERYLTSGERRLIGKPRILRGAVKKDGTPITLELSLSEVYEGDQRRFIAAMRIINSPEPREEESDTTSEIDSTNWSNLSDEEADDSDVLDTEITQVESNLEKHVKSLKENLFTEVKEMKEHMKSLSKEVASSRREITKLKRELHRKRLAEEAMKKIIFDTANNTGEQQNYNEQQKTQVVIPVQNPSVTFSSSSTSLDLGCPFAKTTSTSTADFVPLLGVQFQFNFFPQLKDIISNEIKNTKSATLLFRTDNESTKLMTLLLTSVGLDYLEATLGDPIRGVLTNKSSTRKNNNKVEGYEINPALLRPQEKRNRNLRLLTRQCNIFIESIVNSQKFCPPVIQAVLAHIYSEVQTKWPKKKRKKHVMAVGGLFFLRFLCPAIILPQHFGLISPDEFERKPPSLMTGSRSLSANLNTSNAGGDGATSKGDNAQRGLVLISKILQNIVNGIKFHSEYEDLNNIVSEKTPLVTHFLLALCCPHLATHFRSFSQEPSAGDSGGSGGCVYTETNSPAFHSLSARQAGACVHADQTSAAFHSLSARQAGGCVYADKLQ
jgi:PAS domain S-box-containing protein